jgi:hypothetical protein
VAAVVGVVADDASSCQGRYHAASIQKSSDDRHFDFASNKGRAAQGS